MSEEERLGAHDAFDVDAVDEHTTAPHPAKDIEQPAKPVKWEMPKPVFKKTSGLLPTGWIKQFENTSAPADDIRGNAAAARAAAAAAAPALEIGPQPELPEESEPEGAAVPAQSAPRSSKLPLLVLFAVVLVALAAIFLAAIYYFFIYPEQPGNTF